MKLKKTILGLAVVAVAGVNAFNAVSSEQSKLSDLQMENVEMLAEAEPYGFYCRYNSYFNDCAEYTAQTFCLPSECYGY